MSMIKKCLGVLLLCMVLLQLFPLTVYAGENSVCEIATVISSNPEDDIIDNETMLIIPIISMWNEGGNFLFTGILIGIVIGIIGTLLVQKSRKNRKV